MNSKKIAAQKTFDWKGISHVFCLASDSSQQLLLRY